MGLVDEAVEVQSRKERGRYRFKVDAFLESHPEISVDDMTEAVNKCSDTSVLAALRGHGYTGTESSVGSWRRAHVPR